MKHLAFALFLGAGLGNADTTEQNPAAPPPYFPNRDIVTVVKSPDGAACVRIQEKSLEVASLTTNSKSEPLINFANPGEPLPPVSVLWSPDSTKVVVSYECKRGNEFHFFQIKDGKVTEIDLWGAIQQIGKVKPKHQGRFAYLLPLSWTKDGKLNVSIEGNDTGDKEEDWKWFRIPGIVEIKEGKLVLVSTGKIHYAKRQTELRPPS